MARNDDSRVQSFFSVTATETSHSAAKPHQMLRARFRGEVTASRGTPRGLRLAALAVLGISVGGLGAVGAVSYVQANDNSDMYAVMRNDERMRQARRMAAPQVVNPTHSSYAPVRYAPVQPLAAVNQRGMIRFPDFNLNPFLPSNSSSNGDRTATRANSKKKTAQQIMAFGQDTLDTVSGAANVPRSICVRLCDGYQHPLGYIRDTADIPGHEALCTATFPGVPTRVFRVAAGADGVDNAVGPDGRTYRSLPMAYAYQTSIDPACARPRTGQQTVSILKDFTLRAGDAVVVNGRPRIFNGATSYPFTAANFRDFRSSNVVSEASRRQLDAVVGVSRQERLQREVRQMSRVREANAVDTNRAIDIVRGGPSEPTSRVRVIEIGRR